MKIYTIALILSAAISAAAQSGGTYTITHSVIAGGGGSNSTGGTFAVDGTAGQPSAGTISTGSNFSVGGGFWYADANAPTAANGTIAGAIADSRGAPISGVTITLSGTQNRQTITDANGNYRFDDIETNGFYTVTPSRANYSFSPFNRSLSLVGNQTEAVFTGTLLGDNLNPLDTPEYFVRQQYLDVLGREPDEGGFNYWSDRILACGPEAACVNARRRAVAAAFFIEQEFQQSGSFILDLYKGGLGRRPVFAEYSADRLTIVGGANLETKKAGFAEAFVQRAEFMQKYAAHTTSESFVDAAIQHVRQSSGVDLSLERQALIRRYDSGANQIESRSLVLRDVAENTIFKQAEYNAAFVLTEYFAYLKRDPDQSGYDFWLNVLNSSGRNASPGTYHAMVCAFITSAEYQRRFSSVITHSNSECGP